MLSVLALLYSTAVLPPASWSRPSSTAGSGASTLSPGVSGDSIF